jgi:hypothetical protein
MRLEVEITKKYFFAFMLAGLLLIGAAGVVAYYSDDADPSVMGHSVDEMDWEGAINSNVTAAGYCIGNETTKSCIQSWNGQWIKSGDYLYYNGGRVGIGTAAPTQKLNVAGDINATGDLEAGDKVCIRGDCKSAWPSAARPTAKWYSWEGASGSKGHTSNHDFCFLTRVYAHDDDHDSRTQGCYIQPASTGLAGPQKWEMITRGEGGSSYCSAVCLNWQ